MIVRAASQDERRAVIEFIAKRLRMDPRELVGDMPFEALGALRGEDLIGAVIYTNYRGPSIETHWAGEAGWLTREHLRGIFAYPFQQLRVRRVTGIVHRKNKRARRIAEKIGFKLEGVCRDGFETGDACIYGITKSDCRWLKESVS